MTDEADPAAQADSSIEETKPAAKKKTTKKKAARKRAPKKKPAAKKKARGGAAAPWTFPRNTLEDALRIARAIEDKNAGNPMPADQLVKAVGYRRTKDWRFLDLLRSANQYGLVEGTGEKAVVSLEPIGEDVVAPSSSSQRQRALLEAFRNVEDFREIEEFYGGKRIPEDEFFENTVVRQFEIPRDRVKAFSEVFTSNLEYLNLFNARSQSLESTAAASEPLSEVSDPEPSEPRHKRVREYLDTCFMMMPFGDWFDRYYQEIYVPSIKEAGFEPIRADELFSTGTVVEQIWEEVQKSTVLLADVTGKNANVFYELGLAHAAGKPVVLTAASIEDVPFDLQHLRVIVYDIREPRWAEMLSEKVTDFLKNAKADPARSIPQPFRDLAESSTVDDDSED